MERSWWELSLPSLNDIVVNFCHNWFKPLTFAAFKSIKSSAEITFLVNTHIISEDVLVCVFISYDLKWSNFFQIRFDIYSPVNCKIEAYKLQPNSFMKYCIDCWQIICEVNDMCRSIGKPWSQVYCVWICWLQWQN